MVGGSGGLVELWGRFFSAAVERFGASWEEGAVLCWLGEFGRLAGDLAEVGVGAVDAGEGGEEGVAVGMEGLFEEFADGAFFDDVAGVHDGDVVGDLGDDAEVVGDEEDGGAAFLAEALELVEDLGLDGDVEGAGGLVGDEELGVECGGDADHDALAHAAGELEGVGAGNALGLGEADAVEEFDGAAAGLFAVDFEVAGEDFGDLAADVEDGIEAGDGVLEDHGDAAAAVVAEVVLVEGEEVGAAECDGGGGEGGFGGEEAWDGHADGGFAGAGFADDGEELAGLEAKAGAGDGTDGGVAGAVFDGEVAHLEEGLRHGFPLAAEGAPARDSWGEFNRLGGWRR